jgi:SAM-dependent methyltransferase
VTSPDPYDIDAHYYDLMHEGFTADIGLWQSFAGRTDLPVLEIGAGTGRIAIPLAKMGHQVTAIDPSRSMLAVARLKAMAANVNIDFRLGAQDLALEPERYGFALMAQDVFLYNESGEDQLTILRGLAGALHFNGTLAIDLPGPAMGLDPTTNGQATLVYDGPSPDGQALEIWHLHQDDLATQSRRLLVRYETLDAQGVLRRRVSEHLLRYAGRYEMEYLLHLAGLKLQDVYGDYELGPLTNDSERMILIARRARG